MVIYNLVTITDNMSIEKRGTSMILRVKDLVLVRQDSHVAAQVYFEESLTLLSDDDSYESI